MPKTAVVESLSVEETKREAELLPILKRGIEEWYTFYEAAHEYRETKLYRARHATWEAFCETELGISKRRVDQLIKGAEVRKQIESNGNLGSQILTGVKISPQVPPPTTERQTRELAKAPEEKQAEAWEAAVEEAGGEQPTAAQVKAAVEKVTEEQKSEPPRDGLGLELPEYLLPSFDGIELFKSAYSVCRELQDLIDEIARHPAGRYYVGDLQLKGPEKSARYRHAKLEAIKYELKKFQPYTRCPWCASRVTKTQFKDCKVCKGSGWVTKDTYEGAPEEYRKAVKK